MEHHAALIYHFCGPVFGDPFRAAVRAFAAHTGANVVTVTSTAGEARPRSAIARFRAAAGDLKRALVAPKERRVPDVNAPAFRRSIAPGSIGVVTGFNQIFDAATIARFRDLTNVHPSILPYYRGPVPTYWCIANGETRTGFTLHRITPRIDDGEILYQDYVDVDGELDPARLAERIAYRAAPVLAAYLDAVWRGERWTARTVEAPYKVKAGYARAPHAGAQGRSAGAPEDMT